LDIAQRDPGIQRQGHHRVPQAVRGVGLAGTGKSFAVDAVLERERAIRPCLATFENYPTIRLVVSQLNLADVALTGPRRRSTARRVGLTQRGANH
jgi:hypothetical protein